MTDDNEYDIDDLVDDLAEATDTDRETVNYIAERILLFVLGRKIERAAEQETTRPMEKPR